MLVKTFHLLTEAYTVISLINEAIVESMSQESEFWNPLVLSTDGNRISIEFLGNEIWRDDEDEREFNEETNKYESIQSFLTRVINQQLELIKVIKI